MKNILKNTALALLSIPVATLFSCEKEIDADIPAIEPFVSVASTFCPDSTWKVWVGKSSHILDDQGPGLLDNAIVEIYEEGTLLETIAYSGYMEGFYWGTTYPQEGKNYSIRVTAPGYDVVTGESRTPVAVPIQSTTYEDSVFTLGDGYYEDEITLSFQDPAGEENYYGITLGYIDTLDYLGDTLIYWSAIYFHNNDPSVEQTMGETSYFTDVFFDGETRSISLQFDNYFGQLNKNIFVILTNMTREHYLFQITYNAYQSNYGNPFAEPVQLHNNLSGGVGIFAGYSNAVKAAR